MMMMMMFLFGGHTTHTISPVRSGVQWAYLKWLRPTKRISVSEKVLSGITTKTYLMDADFVVTKTPSNSFAASSSPATFAMFSTVSCVSSMKLNDSHSADLSPRTSAATMRA